MAFHSAFAGVMLSAPCVRRELGAVRITVDVVRRWPARITHPVRKGGNGPARCIWRDQIIWTSTARGIPPPEDGS